MARNVGPPDRSPSGSERRQFAPLVAGEPPPVASIPPPPFLLLTPAIRFPEESTAVRLQFVAHPSMWANCTEPEVCKIAGPFAADWLIHTPLATMPFWTSSTALLPFPTSMRAWFRVIASTASGVALVLFRVRKELPLSSMETFLKVMLLGTLVFVATRWS